MRKQILLGVGLATDKDALMQRYEINRHTGFIRPAS